MANEVSDCHWEAPTVSLFEARYPYPTSPFYIFTLVCHGITVAGITVFLILLSFGIIKNH